MNCVKCGQEDLEEAFCQGCVDDQVNDAEAEGEESGTSEGLEMGKNEEEKLWIERITDQARRANIPVHWHSKGEALLTAMTDRILKLEAEALERDETTYVNS